MHKIASYDNRIFFSFDKWPEGKRQGVDYLSSKNQAHRTLMTIEFKALSHHQNGKWL